MNLPPKNVNYLNGLWSQTSLDIRKTGNGRWYDQKVTPDVMAVICDVIMKEIHKNVDKFCPFTIKDIWTSPSFEEVVTNSFSKPSSNHPMESNEYDKFIAQPLRVLEAAGILEREKWSQGHEYNITSSEAKNLITQISGEMVACDFLDSYITKTLQESELIGLFEDFWEKQDDPSFHTLKEGYATFIKKHTPIKGDTECNRVFSKVLNICSFIRRKKGVSRGRLSSTEITLHDIRYNRTNWRDDAVGKPKHIPRQIWRINPRVSVSINADPSKGRKIQATVNAIKKYHNYKPEIHDAYSGIESGTTIKVEGHHIFPKAKYPDFAEVKENIILLTPNQHTSAAHSGPGVYQISEEYQALCLSKKLEVIASCDSDPNCNFYSLTKFSDMLVSVGILSKKELRIDEIKRQILAYYLTDGS